MIDTSRLRAAKVWVVHKFPCLATAVFAYNDDLISTLPDAVDWSTEQLGAEIIHQVMHIVRQHPARGHSIGALALHEDEWNLASDAEIFDDFRDLAFIYSPVLPSHFGCQPGRLAEEYYHQILSRTSYPSANCASASRGSAKTSMRNTLLLKQIARGIQEFLRTAGSGSVPDGLERWANENSHSVLNWRALLFSRIHSSLRATSGMVDYSYRKPSRRAFMMLPIVVPSLRGALPTVAVVVDTSSSMTNEDLGVAFSEIESICASAGLSPNSVQVLTVDAEVHQVTTARRLSRSRLLGGGGTDMRQGLAFATSMIPKPSCVIVLTDGDTPWPEVPPIHVSVVAGVIGNPNSLTPSWLRRVDIPIART